MRLSALMLLSAAGPLAAEPVLDWPVACTLGEDCFVEDYLDRDPGQGLRDYACGLNTRDGHSGTDIALLSFDAVETGVAVLAAASGTVLRVRDGMADDWRMPGVTERNACGNGLVIAHADGWTTQYCHLRNGSVDPSPGDRVEAGEPIGMIGLSGQTTHPHLHLSVMHNGTEIDPFRPTAEGCGAPEAALWTDPPPYHDTLLRLAGFSTSVPDYDALRGGTARIDEARPAEPLVVYAEAGHARHGDVVTIRAEGPEGEIFSHSRVMKSPQTSQLPAFGRRAPDEGWPAGAYLGQITLTRSGMVIANRWAHVTVSPP